MRAGIKTMTLLWVITAILGAVLRGLLSGIDEVIERGEVALTMLGAAGLILLSVLTVFAAFVAASVTVDVIRLALWNGQGEPPATFK